ncbi:MAG TPA: hypothetical protein VLT89_03085 [Usitatibacter sp.]|nr:hypothetical protein [Usitatibacter sp.]
MNQATDGLRKTQALAWSLLVAVCLSSSSVRCATPAIATGSDHSAALSANGTVLTWGSDLSGQLGVGRTLQSVHPIESSGVSGVRAVSSGADHTVALKTDGTLWAWGKNSSGQLADGTTTSRSSPAPVIGLTGVITISARGDKTVALKGDGTVWTLGLQSAAVSGLSGVVAVSQGDSHTVALKDDGTVWGWGANSFGQLGDGTTKYRSSPVQVSGLADVVGVSAGGSFTVAVTRDGTVWAWGYNGLGDLGDGTTTNQLTPVQVSGVVGATAISAGEDFTVALKADGSVWAWGSNYSGQLGTGAINPSTAAQVIGLTGVVAVSAGNDNAVALKGDGSVWAWGRNSNGQLGDGTATDRSAPVQAIGLTGMVAVSAGGNHSVAVKGDGSVWAWGYNGFGQLGDGTPLAQSTPVQVSALTGAIAISAGGNQTIALKGDGTVWSWGDNSVGQLGDGTTTNRSAPVQVVGLSNVVAISTGSTHTVALKADGSVWAWGNNSDGRLGDGTTMYRLYPVQVIGLTGVIAISAGDYHTVALKGDGSLWTWGNNSNGRLGDGTTTNRSAPVQVIGLTGGLAISAGGAHTVAAKGDGTVWAWGGNFSGQLGDGTTADRSAPVQVSGLTGAIAVSAGGNQTVALKRDGTAWAWGGNAVGQLGDGTTTDHSSPVQVIGLKGAVAISTRNYGNRGCLLAGPLASPSVLVSCGFSVQDTQGQAVTILGSVLGGQLVAVPSLDFQISGDAHTVALEGDGSVWAWGDNSFGQLGDGTFALRATPAAVHRENGGGSLQTNDWFLNLNNPSTKVGPSDKSIPSYKTPAFLVQTSGDVSPTANVTSDVQFRAQDRGHPIYVFAYAPSSLMSRRTVSESLESKDNATCVLAQLTPSGTLQQASANNLQSYVNNVVSTQHQAVTILNNIAASAIGGSTFCIGTGVTGAQSVSVDNSVCVATIPDPNGKPACLSPDSGVVNYTDLWWNLPPGSESGWGINLNHQGDIIFGTLFTYNASGNPLWLVLANGARQSDGSYSGAIYTTKGPPFNANPWSGDNVLATQVGTMTLNFSSINTGTLSYVYNGTSVTKQITREVFGSSSANCEFTTGDRSSATNYQDLWWFGQAQHGWGVNVTQQGDVVVATLFDYDLNGDATWFILAHGDKTGTGVYSGDLYTVTGPPFNASPWTAIKATKVGNMTFAFSGGNTGTLTYTVNGAQVVKQIQREIFSSPTTLCQ